MNHFRYGRNYRLRSIPVCLHCYGRNFSERRNGSIGWVVGLVGGPGGAGACIIDRINGTGEENSGMLMSYIGGDFFWCNFYV